MFTNYLLLQVALQLLCIPLAHGSMIPSAGHGKSARFPLMTTHGRPTTPKTTCMSIITPDYLVTDSNDLMDKLPLSSFVTRPRNLAGSALVLAGIAVSIFNVLGKYDDSYLTLEAVSVSLGFFNAGLDYRASLPPYSADTTIGVSPNIRSGIVDDALINLYSGIYTGSASWLALRLSLSCPQWLVSLDPEIGPLALSIFFFSLACPVLTLVQHHVGGAEQPLQFLVGWARRQEQLPQKLPKLSATELLRARALLGLGIVGCIYSPEVITLLSLGQDWWERVMSAYPGQAYLESTTALFGVFATQASMMFHRAGKAGVSPYGVLVPSFGIVCVLLTILPCLAGLYWLGEEVSFFEFYRL